MALPTATGIAGATHLTAIIDTFNDALAGIDLSVILVYVIDTCPSEALPELADQLNVLGYNGWALATTEEEQREILRRAIELQRRKGTPWAIKTALGLLGFGSVEITEGASAAPGARSGVYLRNGYVFHDTAYYHDPFWFSVLIDIAGQKGISASQNEAVRKVIEAYKNARSWLNQVAYVCNILEVVEASDSLTISRGFFDMEEVGGPFHNGRYLHDGSVFHNAKVSESVSITVRNTSGTIIQIINL